jgi:hypothetical protein
MVNNTIIEQVTNFNYFGCQFGSSRNCGLENKPQRCNYLRATTKRTLLNKTKRETILKFYKVLAVPFLLYDNEW